MATWSCVSCGGENPEGMRFCGHCGAHADAPWVCAACAGENAPTMRFCGHCGTLRDAPTAAPAPSAPPQAEPEPDIAGALRSFVADQVADRLVEGGGTLPEERRLIPALFADVSGFTSLADRLGPEQLLEVIAPVISGLSRIGGTAGRDVRQRDDDAPRPGPFRVRACRRAHAQREEGAGTGVAADWTASTRTHRRGEALDSPRRQGRGTR